MALWVPISPAAQQAGGLAVPTQSLPFGNTMTFILNFCTPQPLSEGQRVLGGTESPLGWAQQLPGATQVSTAVPGLPPACLMLGSCPSWQPSWQPCQ